MKESADDRKRRIVRAAAEILSGQGRDAVTTRSVSERAGVQPPAIYRLFGDMGGLLDAVTSEGFEGYLDQKAAMEPSDDPVEDLRAGWDMHISFGLEHPAYYTLMYGRPEPVSAAPAAARAQELLHGIVGRIAGAGRLAVDVERAAQMVHAAGMGATFSLLALPPEERDPGFSERLREAVIAAVTTGAEPSPAAASPLATRAVALAAALGDDDGLTPGERALLGELLSRLARGR